MRDRTSDQHRSLTKARTGRALGPDEIVHHKNENKTDNADTNLEVQPRGAHTAAHNRARELSKLRAALRMSKEGRKLY
jgi:hypothetical protein